MENLTSLAPGLSLLRLEGEIDGDYLARNGLFYEDGALPSGLILDLSRVHAIDQDGLAWLVDLKMETHAQAGKLVLLGLQPAVKDLFRKLDLTSSFTFATDLTQAIHIAVSSSTGDVVKVPPGDA